MWPALKTSNCPANVYTDFAEQLHKHKDQLRPSSAGVSVASIITDAVREAIQQTSFTQGYYSYASRTASGHENRSKALRLLRLCVTTGNCACAGLVFRRLLDPSFHNPEYIENVLVPFLPELRHILINNRIPLAVEPFSAAFKSIIMLWTSKVLGLKPGDATKALVAKMQTHSCRCLHCTQVFNFLTASIDKTYWLNSIGAPKRKHVEQELSRYAQGAATWVLMNSRPQGLMVSMCEVLGLGHNAETHPQITKTDAIFEPVKWDTIHAKGTGILKTISADQRELQTIFGADYQTIMEMLAGRIPAAPLIIPSLNVNAETLSNTTTPPATGAEITGASAGVSTAATAASAGAGSST